MKRRLLTLLCVLGLMIPWAAAAQGETAPAGTPVPEETAVLETSAPEETPAGAETDPPAPAAVPPSYTDVPGTAWYADEVAAVTEQGLMTGVGEGLFAPGDPVTRAAVVTVLWRLEGCPQPAEGTGAFSDVTAGDPASAWYLSQTAWAKEAGIASGYGDGTFRGGAAVSREELAVFLYRYAVYKGQPVAEGVLTLFEDAGAISAWAAEAMAHVVGTGLFRGDEQQRLNPQGKASRAELAAILWRMQVPVVG